MNKTTRTIHSVIGDKMYRLPLSINSLRQLCVARIDITEYVGFDPFSVMYQAEFARREGVTRQEINRRVNDGQYDIIEYAGRKLISMWK